MLASKVSFRAFTTRVVVNNTIPRLFLYSSYKVAGIRGVAAARSFATIGTEGSDSDFAPKKPAPPASAGRDVASEIKKVLSFFVRTVFAVLFSCAVFS